VPVDEDEDEDGVDQLVNIENLKKPSERMSGTKSGQQ
jgi:hypothetical protein